MGVSSTGLWALCLGIGVLPVLAFLVGLVLLDSYKLIRVSAVALALAGGAVTAWICLGINSLLPALLDVDFTAYSR